MELPESDYFVLRPLTGNRYELFELSPGAQPDEAGFVLVDYYNPTSAHSAPAFFSIIKRGVLELETSQAAAATPPILLKPTLSKQQYVERVNHLMEHIQRGDIYEINFCQEFIAEAQEINCVEVFKRLCAVSEAPYKMMVRTGHEIILCASPELFLKRSGDSLISKPIKGTIRRGSTAEEDEALKHQLQHSLKDRTENVMAVDVARNDLSMLASRGSVSVNKLFNIETFATAHQMVSTVTCRLKEDYSLPEILEKTFPMASMTGAPKRSAMDLTDRYENFRRNHYSGCMGFVNGKDFELCVVIRSIFYDLRSKRLSIAVGGAITYLSDPEKEYEECLVKASGMLKALNARIETA